ncbi:aldo/keto reductase [[Clostridium] fimetarium]|uniref:Predicted oxidoreductase n=1 Tax=[Clostridium] fimetarium TaxID=99656 RepID=A0A1I0RAY7_9FIRM|nr:aldo/keto reductase [[Clostridium] fimetarium]SEW38004.1 Predicted oxidoreductase [[Clostridium] fimetarium]
MNYKKMNGTGIKVSEMCLGTMMFGSQTSKEDSFKIINYAIENGVNFIDTADAYNAGESERIVGEALEGRREEIILATKVRFKVGDEVNNSGLNRRHILKQVDNSLKNLRTDYIDIYYLHAMDDDVDFEETFDTMTTLVRSGKVRYIGISNFPAWQVSDMLGTADKRNFTAPIVTQNLYNLLNREVESELVPCIQKHHLGMTVYNPIAGGLLSGKYDFNQLPTEGRFAEKANYMARYWKSENFEIIKKLEKIAADKEISLLELSMKWCIAHPYVDSVISGVSRLEQLQQNITAMNGISLDDDTMIKCEEIGKELLNGRTNYFK